jgi:hypothetical protein
MRYSGRDFSSNEIKQIQSLIKQNPTFTRFRLSKEVCQLFKWLKPDGNLKDMSCRVAMLRMHRDGIIDLPAPTHAKGSLKKINFTPATDPQTPIICAVNQLPPLRWAHSHFPGWRFSSLIYQNILFLR